MPTFNLAHLRSKNIHSGGAAPLLHELACPRCGSAVYRVRRKPVDRLLSLVNPAQRFRCRADKAKFYCAWEGTIHLNNIPVIAAGAKTLEDSATDALNRPAASRSTAPRTDHRQTHTTTDMFRCPSVSRQMLPDVMMQTTLDAISDAVILVNLSDQVIYLNRVAEEMTGWLKEQAVGKPAGEIFLTVDAVSRDLSMPPSRYVMDEDTAIGLTLGNVLIRRDGTEVAIEESATPIRNHIGRMVGAVIVFHTVEQSQQQIQKMSHLAHHDSLTGLPNRALLAERMHQSIGLANRNNKLLALLFVDVDRFKCVNDAFGHKTGDQLLQEVARTLLACVRTTDTVSRIGGDEFVILLPQIEGIHDPERVAEKLLTSFARRRTIGGHELDIKLSIGISVYPDDGIDTDSLLQKADCAMYRNKEYNRTRCQPAASNAGNWRDFSRGR